MRHSAQHQLWEKYLKSRGHAFSPGSRRVLQISFCVLIEAIGLKTETDLLMAEPAAIQQIRHRPWLKQPRLEYQADFSFGKVIFGPSFLICNMGGPRDPHLLHFNLRCFWNRFSSPKVPTIRIWTKRFVISLFAQTLVNPLWLEPCSQHPMACATKFPALGDDTKYGTVSPISSPRHATWIEAICHCQSSNAALVFDS